MIIPRLYGRPLDDIDTVMELFKAMDAMEVPSREIEDLARDIPMSRCSCIARREYDDEEELELLKGY